MVAKNKYTHRHRFLLNCLLELLLNIIKVLHENNRKKLASNAFSNHALLMEKRVDSSLMFCLSSMFVIKISTKTNLSKNIILNITFARKFLLPVLICITFSVTVAEKIIMHNKLFTNFFNNVFYR